MGKTKLDEIYIFKISIKMQFFWCSYWYQNSIFVSFGYYWAGSLLTTVRYHELFDATHGNWSAQQTTLDKHSIACCFSTVICSDFVFLLPFMKVGFFKTLSYAVPFEGILLFVLHHVDCQRGKERWIERNFSYSLFFHGRSFKRVPETIFWKCFWKTSSISSTSF